jgi:mannose-6-phosphate isomerase
LRDLHVEKALQVMRFGQQNGGKIEPVCVRGEKGLKEVFLAACPYFATEKWEITSALSRETEASHFDILIFLEGQGEICCKNERLPYRPTEVWLLPAYLGAYQIDPCDRTALLRTYVPRDLDGLAADWVKRGVKETELPRLIHS